MTHLAKSTELPRLEADVLVIEDETLMSALLKRYIGSFSSGTEKRRLRGAPESDLTIVNYESGWDLLETDLSQVKVAVVDLLTPKINGVDFIRNLKKRYPNIGIIPISGMATEAMKRSLREILPVNLTFLAKPLRREEFLETFVSAWNSGQTLSPNSLRQPAVVPKPDENLKEAQSEPMWTAVSASNPLNPVSVIRKGLRKRGET